MNKISFPLKSAMQGSPVADLHEALQVCLDRHVLFANDERAHRELSAALKRERSSQTFGEATNILVSIFQSERRLQATGEVDEPTANALNALLTEWGLLDRPREPAPPPSVKGYVRQPDGTPLARATVKAFDRSLRTETFLAEAVTGDDGSYEIRYQPSQLVPPGKSAADLIVRVRSAQGADVAHSELVCHASAEAIIDLVVDNLPLRGPSEYVQVVRKLQPVLGDVSPGNLKEVEIDYVACTTDLNAEHIRLYVQAARLEPTTAVPGEALYGLFRQDVPTNLRVLVVQDAGLLRNALDISVRDNIIGAELEPQFDNIVKRLGELKIELALLPSEDGFASIGDLLRTSSVPSEKYKTFLTVAANHEGTGDSLWKTLHEMPEFRGDGLVDELQFTLQLGLLTQYHLPMVRELQQMRRAGTLSELKDLAKLDEAAWLALINKPTTDGRIVGVPSHVPAGDEAQRAKTYAKALANLVEQAFPTAVIAHRIQVERPAGSEQLIAFFNQNPQFDFHITNVDKYFRDTAILEGVTDANGLKESLKSMQRMFKITPHYGEMRVLLDDGHKSAQSMARMGQAGFIETYANKVGGVERALELWDGAHSKATTALATYLYLNEKVNHTPLVVWPGGLQPDDITEIELLHPTWTTLFGPFDLCECEHCRSIFSPAAYLVDLLAWLKDRPAKNNSAKGVLLKRRPDLAKIELSCVNTNTPLPYVDLVLEILENAVFPLSTFPQTSWSAEELVANPEHINDGAYKKLADAVFPWILPFNLPVEEARVYLDHLGVPRHQLIEVFPPATGPLSHEDHLAAEYVGLTAEAWQIIADENNTQPWRFWGLQQNNNTVANPAMPNESIPEKEWVQILGHVPVFLHRSELSYQQLLELIDLNFIDPEKTLSVKSSDKNDPATCDLNKLVIENLNGPALDRIHRFVRLWRKLGWKMVELDHAIAALGNQKINSTFLRKVSCVQRLRAMLKVPLTEMMSWWSLIDRTDVASEKDPLGKKKSLFDRLFLNKSVLNPEDMVFQKLKEVKDANESVGILSDHIPNLLAAFQIGAKDFSAIQQIIAASDQLTLSNVSSLFRVVSLAKALKLSIPDFLSLRALVDFNPFDADQIQNALSFVKAVIKIRASGFTVAELDYLLRHRLAPSSSIAQSDDAVALLLSDLRTGLQKIREETKLVADPNGEVTRSELVFLEWTDAHIEQSLATLSDAVNYDVPLAVLPAGVVPVPSATHEVPLAALPTDLPKLAEEGISYDSSTKKLKSTHAITSDERTLLLNLSSESNYQHAVEALYDLGQISYVATTHRLQFTGAMTQSGQAYFLSVASDPNYQSAVKKLFEAPRTFVSMKMKAFDWPAWSAPLKALPKDIVFPDALKTRIFHDATASELRFSGLMAEADAVTLRNLSTNSDYQTAVDSLFNAPNAWEPNDNNQFLTSADVAELFDAATPREQRFQLVLSKLLPHRRTSSSENLIKQTLAGALELETKAAEELLTKWVYSPVDKQPLPGMKRRCITDFLDTAFAESHPKVKLSPETFEGPFKSFRLLHKIALIIAKFSVTTEQLTWLFDYGPKIGWLDLNTLPLEPIESGIQLFHGWERLAHLFDLRNRLPLGASVLADVLSMARDQTVTEQQLLQKLSEQTDWNHVDLLYLVGPKAFGFKFPDAYLDEQAMERLAACFVSMKRLGVSAESCIAWSDSSLEAQDGRSAKQTVKAKYAEAQWLEVAPPLRNALREQQRAALVAYLVTNPLKDQTGKPFWQDVNGLYGHFLIDVEMSPCMMTSRIKQGICSIQLFVQRALMGFEPGVSLNEDAAREWKWMNNGPFWEANRHVLVNSENWAYPDVRDDKSPFFKELENELLQREVTKDTVEEAFLHYLEKLDQVAHLEVVGMYHQQEYPEGPTHQPSYLRNGAKPTVDILHVFGRTHGDPQLYFYRRWADRSYWTAWEKVDLDIEGDHLIPVIWNRRLYLFWAILTEKPVEDGNAEKKHGPDKQHPNYYPPAESIYVKNDSALEWDGKNWFFEDKGKKVIEKVPPDPSNVVSDPAGPLAGWRFEGNSLMDFANGNWIWWEQGEEITEPPKSYWELKLAWSEYKDGGWSAKRTSKPHRVDTFYPREQYTFKALPRKDDSDGETLALRLYGPYGIWTSGQTDFTYDDCKGDISDGLSPIFKTQDKTLAIPYKSEVKFMSFRETDGSDNRLYLKVENNAVYTGVLRNTPGTYSILYPHQDEKFVAIKHPFFYQDDAKTFFVSPETLVTTSILGQSEVIPGYGFMPDKQKEVYKPDQSQSTKLLFRPFYHPFVCEFIKRLKRDGIDGLLRRETQALPFISGKGYRGYTESQKKELQATFSKDYQPVSSFVTEPYPIEDVDFSPDGAYALYNWELFFHIPFLIGDRLKTNYRFEEAQRWLRYIFDETANFSPSEAQIEPKKDPSARYWKVLPFYNNPDAKTSILRQMELLQYQGTDANILKKKSNLENLIAQWRDNPYQPHLIARQQITPHQKAVVMADFDNEIAWGDQLFRQDTIESINQAVLHFILPAQILGRRPEKVPPRGVTKVATYEQLESELDKFSNAAVQIENLLSLTSAKTSSNGNAPLLPFGTILYFCIPKNEKLLAYWDTVADRLFKIRHCMNIEGVVRTLPLFEPPIDPGLLVKATAAGIDLSSILNDLHAPLPHYKLPMMMAKAHELCAEVKALGSALLSALEKRDAEAMALLRSTHELKLLDAARQIKKDQIDEAKQALAALEYAEQMAMARFDYYNDIQFMNPSEKAQLDSIKVATILQAVGQLLEVSAGGVSPVPDMYKGGAGTYGSPLVFAHVAGGSKLASHLQFAGRAVGIATSIKSAEATMTGIHGGYERREDEWELQKTLADKEWNQIAKQIVAAKVRRAIAEKDLENHDLQIENAKEIDAFQRQKFTNRELYDRIVAQTSTLYFQTYKLLYDFSKRLEKTYQHELGVSDTFIQFGYWDSLKKGLLAGEKLSYDLRRMEVAYLDHNRRELEITKHISLRLLDPVALIRLKETGTCFLTLREDLFDLDYPGHFMRRIKSVSLTIPAVTGPYTNVSCTLTLLSNRTRTRVSVDSDRDYPWVGDDFEDPRFVYNIGGIQSIATSNAQNDSGMFELNFRDERYLPFEGAGAISTWRLELPAEFRVFDYATIPDVILHIKYTARDGGNVLKQAALQSLRDLVEQGSLYQMFSAKDEFSSDWHKFLYPQANKANELVLDLQSSRFRYYPANKSLSLKSIMLLMKLKLSENVTYDEANPLMYDLLTSSATGESSEVTNDADKHFKHAAFDGRTIDGLIQATPFTDQSPGKPLGKRLLRITAPVPKGIHVEDNNANLDPEAVDDVLVVCEYSLKQ